MYNILFANSLIARVQNKHRAVWMYSPEGINFIETRYLFLFADTIRNVRNINFNFVSNNVNSFKYDKKASSPKRDKCSYLLY